MHKGSQVQSINYFCTQVLQFMNSSPAPYCAIQLKKQKQNFGAADVDVYIYHLQGRRVIAPTIFKLVPPADS